MIKIPLKIEFVLDVLMHFGYEAYIVGGCVRDSLLGITPHDYDVTTSATPEEVISLFDHTIPTGIKHGTVTVVIDNEPIEVTTFRTEGDYSDSRRPDSVEFVSDLKSDLARRDFTVNAIAYNHRQGLKDFFGGINDLENRVLRAVGDPHQRFNEDALRIMRLFRFASQLRFKIDEETYNSAIHLSHKLENISRERIFAELLKAIDGEYPQAIAPLLGCGGLSFLNISGYINLSLIRNLTISQNLRLAVFLSKTCRHPLDTLKALKCSNAQYHYCENFLRLSALVLPQDKADIKNALFITNVQSVNEWLFYLKAIGTDVTEQKYMFLEIIEKEEPYLISHLKIDGKDLQGLGIKGKEIGKHLEALRKIVVQNPEFNTKEKLLELLTK